MFETKISVGNLARHETLEEAQAWLDQNIALGSFGKNERWLLEELFTGEKIEDAIDTRPMDGMYGQVTEYKFKAQYTYTIEDITVAHEKAKRTLAKIQKGSQTASLSLKALNYIRGCEESEDACPVFEPIIKELTSNKPKKARKLIEALKIDDIITEEVKSELLAMLLV